MELTAKYFFDGISAVYDGCVAYRDVEAKGEITSHPTYLEDMQSAAQRLVGSLGQRRRLWFVSEGDACRSQMAAAFARIHAGDRLDVVTGGSRPAPSIDATMQAVMAEKGIDLGFCKPRSLAAAQTEGAPDMVIAIDPAENGNGLESAALTQWDLSKPPGASMSEMRQMCADIETRVSRLIESLQKQ